MKMLRQWRAFSAALLLVSGCYVEPAKVDEQDAQKRKAIPSDHGLELDHDVTSCRYTLSKGCFDGHVAAKTAFNIENKQFFNADDLATRFKELLNVQADGKRLNEGMDGYALKLLTALDNNSFVQGFTYELYNGPTPRMGNLRSDGNFSIDDLAPGNYDIRVSKSVKFMLTTTSGSNAGGSPTSVVIPAGAGVPPASTTPPGNTLPPQPAKPANGQLLSAPEDGVHVTKIYCATLYADSSIGVRGGQRLWETLADFRLHVTDDQCMNGGNQAVLNL